jgi:hypothetical protein
MATEIVGQSLHGGPGLSLLVERKSNEDRGRKVKENLELTETKTRLEEVVGRAR